MKKSLLTFFVIVLTGWAGFAQITGTFSIPGDYTFKTAIAAINTGVTGTGVTFRVDSNYQETFTTRLDGYITTTTGSSASPIIFEKKGIGANPVITAPTGSGAMDAIIAIAGCDYVTFDGIDLQENSLNLDPNSRMEWGYAILKASGTDGSQNITIKNCVITLNKTNYGATYASTGIYANNHTTGSVTLLTVTSVAGANSNLKISGNTIANCYHGIYLKGFASASPYALYDQNNEIGKDGANYITNVGGGTVAAYGIYMIYQNNLTVANNTVTSTMGGTRDHYGICLTTASNASYDLYNNTVTMNFSATDGANANFYPIYSDMGASGTTNTVNVYNNTVTNCIYPGILGAYTYLMFLNNLGFTTNIYGNMITNNSIGSASSVSSGRFRYLWCQKAGTTGSMVIHDNVLTGNTRLQTTEGFGETTMLAAAGSGATLSVYNNVIDNNVVASKGTGQCLYITYTDATSKSVNNNIITNITKANGSVYGLYNANGKLGYFYQNKIQNISASSTATSAFMVGINHTSGTSMYYYNNMIAELSCPASVSTLGYDYTTLVGINIENAGTAKGFYYNTIYLNALTSAATFGSAAILASNLSGVDLRNNILVNVSQSAGLGKTVAIRYRNTSLNGFTSNYNNLYAGPPSANNQIFIYGTGGTYYGSQTLSDYKTLVTPRDLQSVTELPPFIDIAISPYKLQLLANVATQCEAGGFAVSTPVSVTTDYEGDPRFPNPGYPAGSFTPNAPDIGADEFGGTPGDLTPPAIVYTPFIFTNNTDPRILTATITDGSGVGTSAGLPVLYWKINSGSYQPITGIPGSNDTYTFTFGGGVALHDTVSYYIVAQDMAPAPNVGAFPWQGAAGFTTNPPACSTPPATPSSYLVMAEITGVKHVGTGKDYATLTAAVADLNDKYMTGPVTFILDDASYPSESFPIIFYPRPGNSSTNTLTIKPNAGVTPTISGSVAATGLIIFKGLDYATIDGSNSGGTDKSLTIENTASFHSTHTIGITNNGTTDATTNFTLKNCNILGNNTDLIMETYLIVFNENGGLSGGGYDNCLITNNTIKRAKFGIDAKGTASNIIRNLTISNNIIGSATPADYITRWGIAITQTDNAQITGNEVMGPADGVLLDALFGIIFYNSCTNTKILKNKIHDWYAKGLSSYGIKCDSYNNSTTATEISNNLIYNIKTPGLNPGPAQNNAYGIFVRSGGNIKMYNNTIYLSGPFLDGSDSFGPSSACIGIYDLAAPIGQFDIRDNILRNSMTNPNPGAAGSMGRAYGIMISSVDQAAAIAAFSQLNYNDYYIDGFNGSIAQWYQAGYGNILNFETLASWQTFTGKEALSLNENPMFISDTELVPTNVNLNSVGGTKLVTTDFQNKPRYNPCDMGAYEWALLISDYHTLAATNITQTSAVLTGDINTNGEVVETYIQFSTDLSYSNYAIPSGYGSIPKVRTTSLVTLNAPTTSALTLTPNTTYHYRLTGFPQTSAQTQIFGNDMTFTTLPLAPAVVTTAATGVSQYAATLNGTINANGAATAASFEYGLTTDYGTPVTATPTGFAGSTPTPVSATLTGLAPNTLYHYRAVGVNSGGTGNGADMTFTTPPLPPVAVTEAATLITSSGATFNGNVNANDGSTSVTFEYGLTTGYGLTATAVPPTVTGNTATPVSAVITGLQPQTTYHFRVTGTNAGGTSNGSDMTFTTDLLDNLSVTGNFSNDTCFNAYMTITVGGENTFDVSPTGFVRLIAGHSIIMLPGSWVEPGGYLLGHITETNSYCGAKTRPFVAAKTGIDENPFSPGESLFRVFPNPTTGTFTLEISGENETGKADVEIFSMRGEKVFSKDIQSDGKTTLSISDKPTGIYLIRVISGNKAETARIIKQ